MPYPALSLAEAHRRLTAPGSPFEITETEIRGELTRVWRNAPPTLRDVFRIGRGFGDKTFLVYEDERATFEAFARASILFAKELQAMGVGKGDRVAIVMRNLPEWPVAFFGTILAGAIAVPLNAWSTGLELEYMPERFRFRGSPCSTRSDSSASGRISPPARRCVWPWSAAPAPARQPKAQSWEALIGRTADWARLPAFEPPALDLGADDDATLFYTSGTTGKPKGALGTHRNVCSTLFARPYGIAWRRCGAARPRPRPTRTRRRRRRCCRCRISTPPAACRC